MNSVARLGTQAVEPDVVAVQLEPTVADPLPSRELGAPELGDRGGLVRRRVALLVGHDQKHVRRGHAGIVH